MKKLARMLLTISLVAITLVVVFFSTTVVMSFIYELDEALITF